MYTTFSMRAGVLLHRQFSMRQSCDTHISLGDIELEVFQDCVEERPRTVHFAQEGETIEVPDVCISLRCAAYACDPAPAVRR
jgi:hypothetical protein